MAVLVKSWRLAESDISHMYGLISWICNYMADVVPPSTALAFVIKMSEKCKFTSPSVIQVKSQQKTISI
jgi:hypothetical protein